LIGFEEELLEFGAIGFAPRLLIGEDLVDGAVLLGKRAELVQLVLACLSPEAIIEAFDCLGGYLYQLPLAIHAPDTQDPMEVFALRRFFLA
jgi:hypothetical protein